MSQLRDYSGWSHEQLQDRLKLLDTKLQRLEEQMAKLKSLNPEPYNTPADYVDSTSTASTCHNDARERSLPKKTRLAKEFDPSKYSHRLIALKLAYLGKNYNGFEYHPNNETPLPTVEEILWKALMKAKLISPTRNPAIVDGEPNFDGCEYSKCGRTDKGVSAFGQVIGIRVRSNGPVSRAPTHVETNKNEPCENEKNMPINQVETAASAVEVNGSGNDVASLASNLTLDERTTSFHPVDDEIPYCQVINRLLPPDIRILAWCPSLPVDFSARFSCSERHYTYFFTQPAFTPTFGPIKLSQLRREDESGKRRQGYLDISAMQHAARKFEGTHDFRNLCKVDASKQIDNFERHIFHASIVEQNSSDNISISNHPASYVADPAFQEFIDPTQNGFPLHDREVGPVQAHTTTTPSSPGPKLYAFHLHGNAFLWHQVRHMIAILFLVGQGLEPPSMVDDLLDISKNPCKPQYEMADGIPLVLWNCVFPRERRIAVDRRNGRAEDAMEWVYVGSGKGCEPGHSLQGKDTVARGNGRYGVGGVVDDLWRIWRGRKMDEVLAGRLLDVAARQGIDEVDARGEVENEGKPRSGGSAGKGLHHQSRLDGKFGGVARGNEATSSSQKIFQGADGGKYVGTYVPVLMKPRMEPAEVINERYREKKGLNVREATRPGDGGSRHY